MTKLHQLIIKAIWTACATTCSTQIAFNEDFEIPKVELGPGVYSPANADWTSPLGFTFSLTSGASLILLQTPSLAGRWTRNTSSVLTTNNQTEAFEFTILVVGSVEFCHVQSP